MGGRGEDEPRAPPRASGLRLISTRQPCCGHRSHTHTTTGRKTLLKGADTYLAVELLHGILGIADVVILDEGEARRAASDPNLADGAEGTELILKREGVRR